MIVCICNNITDKDLKYLILKTGGDLDLIKSISGAGSSCGSCLEDIVKVIKDNIDESRDNDDLGSMADSRNGNRRKGVKFP